MIFYTLLLSPRAYHYRTPSYRSTPNPVYSAANRVATHVARSGSLTTRGWRVVLDRSDQSQDGLQSHAVLEGADRVRPNILYILAPPTFKDSEAQLRFFSTVKLRGLLGQTIGSQTNCQLLSLPWILVVMAEA